MSWFVKYLWADVFTRTVFTFVFYSEWCTCKLKPMEATVIDYLLFMPTISVHDSQTYTTVPRVHTAFASRGFSIAAPQFGTHSLLTFTLVLHHILSVVFLKPTVITRPSVPPSGSHKCLRFGLWSTLCTIKDFTYLLTYLLLAR